MKKNVKIVQFSLLSIGLILLLSVYFLYPILKKKNFEEETSLNKIESIETEDAENKSQSSTEFVNVTYNGESSGNAFIVKAERAKITDDVNLIDMKQMLVTIFFNDEKWFIECAIGTYNKLNYDIFCSKDVKATNEKITVFSQNLDLVADVSATIYNEVIIIDENNSTLYADKLDYDFEKKHYKVNMFSKEESIKMKLVK